MNEVLHSFRGKRVFITGHTGFKGSWLCAILTEVGAEVMGYALAPSSEPNHFKLLGLERKIRHEVADIRDAARLAESVSSFQPEFVFHLAAQALVRESYADPLRTFETNVMGSANLLDAVRHSSSVGSLVYVTSDKCYENKEWVWGYRETDRLGGHDPYSASKASAEIVFSAYARSFFSDRPSLGAASVRAGNVIGGGDWAADRIVPDCVRAAESDSTLDIRRPDATRPWQHVLEPLSGYLLLAARLREQPGKFGGAWNFGPSTAEVRTVRDVAATIASKLGRGKLRFAPEAATHHEAGLLQLNCDRAHLELDWYPRWDVDRTLDMTAAWYNKIRLGESASDVTRAQIHEYFPELS